MPSVKKYCNNAILIKDGEIIASGSKDDVADRYTLENLAVEKKADRPQEGSVYPVGLSEQVPEFRVSGISDLLCKGQEIFRFKVEYECHSERKNYYLVVAMQDLQRGGVVLAKTFDGDTYGRHELELELPLHMFNNGDYRIFASLHAYDESPAEAEMIGFTNDRHACDFVIRDSRIVDSFGLINTDVLDYHVISRR